MWPFSSYSGFQNNGPYLKFLYLYNREPTMNESEYEKAWYKVGIMSLFKCKFYSWLAGVGSSNFLLVHLLNTLFIQSYHKKIVTIRIFCQVFSFYTSFFTFPSFNVSIGNLFLYISVSAHLFHIYHVVSFISSIWCFPSIMLHLSIFPHCMVIGN